MALKTIEKPNEPIISVDECQHYWVLGSPGQGGASRGVCKLCGKAREFRTEAQEAVWEEERSADIKFWGSGDMNRYQGEGAA